MLVAFLFTEKKFKMRQSSKYEKCDKKKYEGNKALFYIPFCFVAAVKLYFISHIFSHFITFTPYPRSSFLTVALYAVHFDIIFYLLFVLGSLSGKISCCLFPLPVAFLFFLFMVLFLFFLYFLAFLFLSIFSFIFLMIMIRVSINICFYHVC